MAKKNIVTPAEKDLLISTLHYRKVVGFMGLLLTPVLYIFAGFVFPTSISAYYYQASGTIFGGTLCAIGVFLCCYVGYELGDHVGSFLAGVAAILVGTCPTLPDPPTVPTAHQALLGNIHWISATVFFLAITYLCWFQFTRSNIPDPAKRPFRKRVRNGVYYACGIIMVIGLLGILADHLWTAEMENLFNPMKPVLFFETLAIMAFGAAWLIKGEWLLKDK